MRPTPLPVTRKASVSRLLPVRAPVADLRDRVQEAIVGFVRVGPSLDVVLFGLALIVFAVTRFVGLETYPIYFFTDEAIQTVQAANFVENGARDSFGHLLPTYFQNVFYFNLSVSVYAQVIPYLLFGESVVVTRGITALIALSGMFAVGLFLKDSLKIRFWWVGVLLLAITPAWFLHSRTAFEVAIGVSFYAWFIYCYSRYRDEHRLFLYPALLFGALAFYSYNPLQSVVVVTGGLLLISDARYHLANWRFAAPAVLLLLVVVVPFVRFQIDHPGEATAHLRRLDSYWVQDISTFDKIEHFAGEYAAGLNPYFWYDPAEDRDLVRHRMKDYGHILYPTLPFAAIGLALSLVRIRQPAYRTVLIAAIASPIGGALVATAITRNLVFVIPAAIFTSIGLAAIFSLLTQRVAYRYLALAVFAALSVVSFAMLRDAMRNGPTWYDNYGLYGMQYGAIQVFDRAEEYLDNNPSTHLHLTSSWTNGADVLKRFFMPDEVRLSIESIGTYDLNQRNISSSLAFIMTPEEYDVTVDNPKFDIIEVIDTVDYPDGRPGFYFVRLTYSEEADAIFAAEIAERRRPVTEEAIVDGETVSVTHPRFDAGDLTALFDGDDFTLARTMEANPAVIDLTFTAPRPLTGVTITTGTMDMDLNVTVFPQDGAEPTTYSQIFTELPGDPTVELDFDPEQPPAERLRISVRDINLGEFDHVHVREIVLR